MMSSSACEDEKRCEELFGIWDVLYCFVTEQRISVARRIRRKSVEPESLEGKNLLGRKSVVTGCHSLLRDVWHSGFYDELNFWGLAQVCTAGMNLKKSLPCCV